VLIGRAYQHWFWDAPYRALLWDEEWMRPLIEGLFGLSWRAYAGDVGIDRAIQTGIKVVGSLLGLGAVVAAFPRFFPRRTWAVLPVLSGWLVFLALLYSKEQDFRTGLFIEYALQAGAPLFFYYYLKRPELTVRLDRLMRLAVALTFIGHGLYAIGYYPRPGNFSTMVINSLGVSLEAANSIIWTAGLLDFIAALWLILPITWRSLPLLYCAVWGFLTALARVWAYFYPEFWMESLHQWTFEFVYRAPHFLIPLALLLHASVKWPALRRG
jgi:hypothetical protein